MKNIFLGLLFTCLALNANAKPTDVFFKNTQNWVDIEVIRHGKVEYLKYAACRVSSNSENAICINIAKIKKSEFLSMRECAGNTAVVGTLSFMLGAPVTVVATAATWGLGAIPTGAAMVYAAHKVNEASALLDVFSEDNEENNDMDSDLRFEHFVEVLENSLNSQFLSCNVSGNSIPVNKTPYLVSYKTGVLPVGFE